MDPQTDRIVSVSVQELPSGNEFHTLINPGVPIPAEATAVHGITDEMVKDAPAFPAVGQMLQEAADVGVLVSFNGRRFDTPLLDTELVRHGFRGLQKDSVGRITTPEIDLYQVLIKKEPRTLEATYERFTGRKLEGAHSSEADTKALPDLLEGMAEALGFDPEDAEDLVAITRPEDEIDRDGKFKKEGGVAVFNFGKHDGEPVREHLDYLGWMLTKDFSAETKAVARYLIRHFEQKAGQQTDMGV